MISQASPLAFCSASTLAVDLAVPGACANAWSTTTIDLGPSHIQGTHTHTDTQTHSLTPPYTGIKKNTRGPVVDQHPDARTHTHTHTHTHTPRHRHWPTLTHVERNGREETQRFRLAWRAHCGPTSRRELSGRRLGSAAVRNRRERWRACAGRMRRPATTTTDAIRALDNCRVLTPWPRNTPLPEAFLPPGWLCKHQVHQTLLAVPFQDRVSRAAVRYYQNSM